MTGSVISVLGVRVLGVVLICMLSELIVYGFIEMFIWACFFGSVLAGVLFEA